MDLRALQVRAAVALYGKQHKKLPATLADLVPAFLPAVPRDPFAGAPLRYQRSGDLWRVWSVGINLVDDGGDNVAPAMPWAARDAVFWSRRLTNAQHRAGYRYVIDSKGNFIVQQRRAPAGAE